VVKRNTNDLACPCGGKAYASCCGRFIDAGEAPPTAEQLMRSRYTAYVLRNEAYLQQSWHASTRPVDAVGQDEDIKWLGLDVRGSTQDGDTATVEFVARYKVAGRAHRLHELSRFVREEGKWFYLDGSFPESKK
jgi:SEC-C motif domain protein